MPDTTDPTTQIDSSKPTFEEKVIEVIKNWFKGDGFTARKITDTPTDALEVVNKKYVDNKVITPGFTQKVTKQTATGAVSITVSGLDLNTDTMYKIIIHALGVAADDYITAVLNNDGGTKYSWSMIQQGAGANTLAETEAQSATQWRLTDGNNGVTRHNQYVELDISIDAANTVCIGSWRSMGANSTAATQIRTCIGGGVYNSGTTVSQIKFLTATSQTQDWIVYIMKATP